MHHLRLSLGLLLSVLKDHLRIDLELISLLRLKMIGIDRIWRNGMRRIIGRIGNIVSIEKIQNKDINKLSIHDINIIKILNTYHKTYIHHILFKKSIHSYLFIHHLSPISIF